jgi:hypothetical protein
MPSPDGVPHIRERYRRTPGFPRSPSVEPFRERSREGRVDDVLFMASRDELPTGRQERRQTPPRQRLYPPLEGDDGRNISLDPRSGNRRSSSADKRNIRQREAGNVYSRLGPRLIVLSDYWKHNPEYDLHSLIFSVPDPYLFGSPRIRIDLISWIWIAIGRNSVSSKLREPRCRKKIALLCSVVDPDHVRVGSA